MQLIVLSPSRNAAHALAEALQTSQVEQGLMFSLYDMQGWTDVEFEKTTEGDVLLQLFKHEFASNRRRFMRQRLSKDPLYGVHQLDHWLEGRREGEARLILQPSSLDEFILLLQEADDNAVLQITAEAAAGPYPDILDEGGLLIEQYLDWRERLGCPIPRYQGTVTELLQQLRAIPQSGPRGELG